MKRLLAFGIIALLATFSTMALSIEKKVELFVYKQLSGYPESRLIDLYKSCFQDFMGPEHLISDTQSAKAYLDEELTTDDEMSPWLFEYCGIDGRYVRVSLRAVKDGCISAELLLDAFIRSANACARPDIEKWRERWGEIVGILDKMDLSLPHYADDRQFISGLLASGRYAVSHSPEYREAYHPHYRIIERHIFETEILPLIERKD